MPPTFDNRPLGEQRSILTADDRPVLVELSLRPARTSPTRYKASLATAFDGDTVLMMPFTRTEDGEVTFEFRLEMC